MQSLHHSTDTYSQLAMMSVIIMVSEVPWFLISMPVLAHHMVQRMVDEYPCLGMPWLRCTE